MYAERNDPGAVEESEITAVPIQPKTRAVDVATVATVDWHGDQKRYRMKQAYRDCVPVPSTTRRKNYPMAPSVAGYKIDMSALKKHVDGLWPARRTGL